MVELILGEIIGATEALELGVVNEVLPADQLLPRAWELARALRRQPRILVLDDSTAGIDVGSKAQLHEILAGRARAGLAVLLVSTDSDELARLSDRVLVFCRGRIAAQLHRGQDLTAANIDLAQLG